MLHAATQQGTQRLPQHAHPLTCAENPKAVLELQRRFACEYAAVLMQGTMALVDAIESAAAD
jgi:hypothetical protein